MFNMNGNKKGNAAVMESNLNPRQINFVSVDLPIYSKKDEIINAVKECDTVIITAETGSGKSTQVPQYLFSAGYDVIVTQPRRIASTSLAMRVEEEIDERYKNVVAYHTAFESTRTEDTKILFCTDGLQMAKGIKDSESTVLIIDEVHEWNLNIETLVAWIKRFRKDGKRIKVVLMSATFEYEALNKFYGDCRCISVEGRNYDVEMITKSKYSFIDEIANAANNGKNVLAFVEGKKEIMDAIEELNKNHVNAEIFPLHGELGIDEQRLCFKRYSLPKVIVSTNIAQTSVTIPDIDVVVDNGMEKRIEVHDGIEGLFVNPISKADCLQRAGRAGRTKNGKYILCSYSDLDDRAKFSIPEIQRLILDKVVLKLASVKIDALDIEFFHQPEINSIINSINTLKLLGALDEDSNITDIGKKMIKMPVSARCSRMIIEAEKYGCVEKVIKAVSIIEIGSLINSKATKTNIWGNDTKYEYSDFTKENKSDILAEIDIYDNIISYKYQDLSKSGINKKNFFRIKELVEKLTNVLSYEMEITDNEPDKFDFIRCIVSGIKDQLYRAGYDNYSYGVNGDSYRLSNNTCAKYSSFYFAFPKTITFKNRWGWDDSMDILTMVTGVSGEELEHLVDKDLIKREDKMDDISYDSIKGDFIIPYNTSYMGLKINSGYRVVASEDPEYDEYKEKYSDLVDAEESKRIFIGKNVYEVIKSWKDEYVLHIDNTDDILESDIKTLKYDGHMVKFHYGAMSNVNLDIIRQNIINRMKDRKIDELISSVPKKCSASIKIVTEEFLPVIGKRDISIPEYKIEILKYVGLKAEKEPPQLCVFDSEDEYLESTIDALKWVIKNFIKQNYSDKNFIVKRNGKKIETKKTESAKEDFHEYCNEIMADITIDNFADQLEFLDEVYKECISQFAE